MYINGWKPSVCREKETECFCFLWKEGKKKEKEASTSTRYIRTHVYFTYWFIK